MLYSWESVFIQSLLKNNNIRLDFESGNLGLNKILSSFDYNHMKYYWEMMCEHIGEISSASSLRLSRVIVLGDNFEYKEIYKVKKFDKIDDILFEDVFEKIEN